MTTIYTARWVLPITSEPVEDGAVAVEGARIVGVGARESLVAKFPEATARDFGEAAILPGFVNCHSHLELTAMRGFLDTVEHDFFAWLKKLTVARLTQVTPDDLHVSAAWGAVEAARAGVTCLGDASDSGATSLAALKDVGLRGVVFQEVFGPEPGFAREQLESLRAKIETLRGDETELARAGVSPHAPYTVSAPLLELVSDYAMAESLPLMLHAAESRAEELLMREARGAFAESLARRGVEWRAPRVSAIQYLERCGVLRARPLLAHCVTADDADIETIKHAGARVAHCPKSNAKFGHARAPFAKFLAAGVAVGLGSDSVASNNTCDLLEEARFATLLSRVGHDDGGDAEVTKDTKGVAGLKVDGETGAGRADEVRASHPVQATDALRAATHGGARALGLESLTGSLAEGLQADLAVVSLAGAHQQPVYDAAAALVFASSARDVLLTVVAGREVYARGRVTTVDEERLRARMNEIRKKLAGSVLPAVGVGYL